MDTTQPGSEPINVNATGAPDHVTLSWTSNPKTTQTVTWRTDTTVNTGFVQYNKRSVAAQVSRLKTDLGDENIYTATLTGLMPGARYYYRVGDGKNWSPRYSFTTERRDTIVLRQN
ncbi:MAG: fibronectin type III domain-containing protein [Methanothrix sp.]